MFLNLVRAILVSDWARKGSLSGLSKIPVNHFGVLFMRTLYKYILRSKSPKSKAFKSSAKWTWSAKAHHIYRICLVLSHLAADLTKMFI